MSEARTHREAPAFAERPTEWLVEDAYRLGCVPLAVSALCGIVGWSGLALLWLGLAVFVAAFFRNPDRSIPGDEACVVAPADGRVVAVGETETLDGRKALRIGIFLSVFDVHVNRAPVAGRVVDIRRSGDAYLAAFNPDAEQRNVRVDLEIETADSGRVVVSQITGLIARRIVCHPKIGDWLRRGDRYGLIRFGSRTDVLLPVGAEPVVCEGDRVRGGESVLARFSGGGAME
ncbi:MAG: phosphatidylserine decarboxylase [Myxococcota bacterium]|nr:phosphatidylserine decarboxylase [Myxococcota bacterium]